MGDLFGIGHQLFVHNWYTSERLFHYLHENEVVSCGITMGYFWKVSKVLKETACFDISKEWKYADGRLKDKKGNFILLQYPWDENGEKAKCGRDDLAPSKLVLYAQRKENKKELLSEQNFKILS